ncbi:MAG TPA: tartrate-resistant acid phosphatase type 5 family protein [Puia sp.]|nr:tartrate-resistant acid phosphatase type 5 family protein [Puia sp.]
MKKKLFLVLSASAILGIKAIAQKSDTINSDLQLSIDKKALNFIALGDWGRNGEYHQREVATEMGLAAKALGTDFFVALGDNFYPSGVRSVHDHRWLDSYEDIYTAHSLENDWYVVPGNHDYKGSVQAEIDYTNIDRRWNMPARYYAKKFRLKGDSTGEVLIVFLDTTPLISDYYFSPDHADVKAQDTSVQMRWLEKVLSDPSPTIKWKIVTGHHPLYSGGHRIDAQETKDIRDRLEPIFDKYHVDLYICGYEHSLQYIKPAGRTHYFISGSGSETTPAILLADGGKFSRSENGFIAFTVTMYNVEAQVISYTGKVLYQTKINKE